jgi:predicted membrane channel-forming protein YqfA (hemolysin III family)
MTNTADASDAVTEAVRALLPDLRRTANITVGVIGLVALGALVGVFYALSSGMDTEHRWKLAAFVVFAAGFVMVLAYRHAISTRETLVIPVLARSIGMTYTKNAKNFVDSLPKRLMPARGIRNGEDHIQGTLGAHAIQMAEVKAETGGKNSRIMFQGIVAQFPNRTAMPAFFLALEDKTRPGMIFSSELSTDGLFHLRSVTGAGGRSYGIWTSSLQTDEPPALAAVVEILTRLENHVGPGAELYSATSNGIEMHVALSQKRNLFHIGGLFVTEADLFSKVRTALYDLTVPLTLAKALIEAEEKAAGKS